MTFTKDEIETAVKEFWQRMGMGKIVVVKNISIEEGEIGTKFVCECNTHTQFDKYDFRMKKTNRAGKLIVDRG